VLRRPSDGASTTHSYPSLVLELDLEKACLRSCSDWIQAPEKIMRPEARRGALVRHGL
jgi:hypothetical protein